MNNINVEDPFAEGSKFVDLTSPVHPPEKQAVHTPDKPPKELTPFKPRFATTLESDFQDLMKQRFLATESGTKYEASGKIDALGQAQVSLNRQASSKQHTTQPTATIYKEGLIETNYELYEDDMFAVEDDKDETPMAELVANSSPSSSMKNAAREQYSNWVKMATKKFEAGVPVKRLKEKGQVEDRTAIIDDGKTLRLYTPKPFKQPHARSLLDVTSLNLGYAKERFQKARDKGEKLLRDSCMTVNYENESWYLVFPSSKERNSFAFLLRVLRRNLLAQNEPLVQ